jgi:hypothetical protein
MTQGIKYTQEEIEKIFQKAQLISLGQYINRKTTIKTKCRCGKIFNALPETVIRGHCQSCGCWNKTQSAKANIVDLTGHKYNKLTVIRYSHTANHLTYWLCRCECGKEIVLQNGVLRRKVHPAISCGDCNYIKNGKRFSIAQEKLHKQIGYGELNFKYKNLTIDIAILDKKIAIEYDEWFWHGNRAKKDRARILKLIRNGWKVLRIKASNNLPYKEQLDNAINILLNSSRKQFTITLNNWGKGKTYEVLREKWRIAKDSNSK